MQDQALPKHPCSWWLFLCPSPSFSLSPSLAHRLSPELRPDLTQEKKWTSGKRERHRKNPPVPIPLPVTGCLPWLVTSTLLPASRLEPQACGRSTNAGRGASPAIPRASHPCIPKGLSRSGKPSPSHGSVDAPSHREQRSAFKINLSSGSERRRDYMLLRVSACRSVIFSFIYFFFLMGGYVQGGFGKREAAQRLGLPGMAQPGPCRRLFPGSSVESFISSLIWFKPTKFTSPSEKLFKQNTIGKSKSLSNWGAASHLPGKALCFLGF